MIGIKLESSGVVMEVDGPVHIYPTYGREHDLEGGGCWCKPEIFASGGSAVFIHYNHVFTPFPDQ